MTDRQREIAIWLRNAASLACLGFGFGFGAWAFVHRGDAIDDVRDLVDILGREYGTAAVFVVFLVWLCRWLKSIGERIVVRHIAYIDSSDECMKQTRDFAKETCNSTRATEKAMKAMEESFRAGQLEQSHFFKTLGSAMEKMAAGERN